MRARKKLVDFIYRVLYAIAYRAFWIYCYLFKPNRRGVYVAVWWDNRVLLVENSYRTQISLPCGGVGAGEEPVEAGRRELFEEVGISVKATQLQPFEQVLVLHDHMHDQVYAFEVTLKAPPNILIDNREVIGARFQEVSDALKMNLTPVSRVLLNRCALNSTQCTD